MKKKLVFILIFFLVQTMFSKENIVFSGNGFVNFQDHEFYFFISLVDDLSATLDIWNVPDVIPSISPITTVRINEPISLFIVYAADKDSINLTYNLRIVQPDGSISETELIGAQISNIIYNRLMLYTANDLPSVIFDDNDDIGLYSFNLEIFDFNEPIVTFILQFNVIE